MLDTSNCWHLTLFFPFLPCALCPSMTSVGGHCAWRGTVCTRVECPGGTFCTGGIFCTGGHPALWHCHLLQAMKAGQGPGNEVSQVSQPVFGISLTTISPAHNTFNHWHHEHYIINMAGMCYHSNYIVFVITLFYSFLIIIHKVEEQWKTDAVPLPCIVINTNWRVKTREV